MDVGAPQRRPSTTILDVDKDEPMLFICDDSNNVIKINLEAYYKHFPSHLQSHDDAASRLKTQEKQGLASTARDHMAAMTLHDVGMEENLFGDTLWRTEVLSISRQMEYLPKTCMYSRGSKSWGNKLLIVGPAVIDSCLCNVTFLGRGLCQSEMSHFTLTKGHNYSKHQSSTYAISSVYYYTADVAHHFYLCVEQAWICTGTFFLHVIGKLFGENIYCKTVFHF